ncbi:LLM class flavin-dependent oxidoreductase [Nonomuraea sp. NPDC050310]|uniref:LLM class flavin-dependent oxidoreductase n=1 Tax=unclassified Nonomuraea TaxID=2593643 RepID=UPI0033C5710A
MSDYGRAIEFGYFLVPLAADPLVERAQLADRLGLELLGIQDHPYQRRYEDTWTLMSHLAALTQRIRIFPDVANLPLRQPAVLAKAAATLDRLSGGRFELGLGAGGFWDAIDAYGGPRRTPGQARAALEEAIEVIRRIWSGERNQRFEGEHYHLRGAQPGPAPAHPIELWLGVAGPKALALAGAKADGWVSSSPWGTPDKLAELSALLDEAARQAGRQPREIRRIHNVNGLITDRSTGSLHGPADQWAEELTELAAGHGLDTFVYWPEAEDERQLRLFAEEVVPEVRRQVALERGRSAEN